MRGLVLLLAASACGRVGFDVTGDAAVVDPCAGRLFCDGFEDPQLAAWGGSEIDGASTVTRDPALGHAGASLHVVGQSGSDFASEFVDVFPLVPPPDQYIRVYIFAPSSSTLDTEPASLANASRNNQIVFSLYDDSLDIHAHGMAGGFNVTQQIVPPRDRWVCYELHVAIGAAGAVELLQDGVQVAEQAAIDTQPPAGDLARVLVGMTSKNNVAQEQLNVDDVVADTAPIGCD